MPLVLPKRPQSRLARTPVATAVLLALASPSVMAQDATTLGEVLVTAQKREQSLQDVPVSIDALGQQKLEELQIQNFKDYVQFLPSVTMQAAAWAGSGYSAVYMRGIVTGGDGQATTSQPSVGMYLDEQPITTVQGNLDAHLYDVARVEALAGPQGTLYGASSMAGTLKLVSNPPDTSGNYGSADVELNSVAHGGVGGTAEAFVNLVLSQNAALRVVGWYNRDAGYLDNVAGSRTYPTSGITQTNAALVENNYNDVDTYGARIALGIDLDDSWTLRPTLMGQVRKANGNFLQERSGAVTKKYQVVQYNPEGTQDKWLQAALTIEGKLGNWDMVATGGHLTRNGEGEFDYSDYAYFYDALYGYGAYFYDNTYTLISPNQYFQNKDRYRRQFGEIRVSSPQDAPFRFIGGLFAQRQAHGITQNYIVDGLFDGFEVPGTVDNVWLTQQKRVDRDYAAFGEISYDLTDRLTATGGIRIYKYKNSLVGFFGYNNPGFSSNPVYACQGPPIVEGSPCTNLNKVTSDSDFIHKLNLTYSINDDAIIYATWSRGFRPGGINRRGSLPPYKPDQLDNYEIGWKTQMGSVRFNGAIYQQDWNDIQLSFLGQNGLTEIRNAGIARIRGVEFDLNYQEGGFTLGISGSYNDAEIRRDFCRIANPTFDCTFDPGDGRVNALLAPAGTRLPVTPKFKGNVVARYDFPLGDFDSHFQLAASHTGKRRTDLRTLENGIKGFSDGYSTVDLSFGVKQAGWRAEIYATNLFDSNGVVSTSVQCLETTCGDPGGASTTGPVFYDYVILPRVVGIKFGKDF